MTISSNITNEALLQHFQTNNLMSDEPVVVNLKDHQGNPLECIEVVPNILARTVAIEKSKKVPALENRDANPICSYASHLKSLRSVVPPNLRPSNNHEEQQSQSPLNNPPPVFKYATKNALRPIQEEDDENT